MIPLHVLLSCLLHTNATILSPPLSHSVGVWFTFSAFTDSSLVSGSFCCVPSRRAMQLNIKHFAIFTQQSSVAGVLLHLFIQSYRHVLNVIILKLRVILIRPAKVSSIQANQRTLSLHSRRWLLQASLRFYLSLHSIHAKISDWLQSHSSICVELCNESSGDDDSHHHHLAKICQAVSQSLSVWCKLHLLFRSADRTNETLVCPASEQQTPVRSATAGSVKILHWDTVRRWLKMNMKNSREENMARRRRRRMNAIK